MVEALQEYRAVGAAETPAGREAGASGRPLRVLFVKDALAWPRSSGHDVHSYYMMRGLAGRGHTVGLLTAAEPDPRAVAGMSCDRAKRTKSQTMRK